MHKVLWFVLTAFIIVGCGSSNLGSTEAGNPEDPILDANFPGAAEPQPTPEILFGLGVSGAICSRFVDECNISTLTIEDCLAQVKDLPDLTPAFGLNPKQYPTVAAVIVAENQHRLHAKRQNASDCIDTFAAISCTDLQINSGYNDSTTKDLSGVATLFANTPDQCLDVFE